MASDNSTSPAPHPASTAWKIIPCFKCRSVPATVEFYTKTLHFNLGGTHPDNVSPEAKTMCSVYTGPKAAANIYLFRLEDSEEFKPSTCMIAMEDRLDEFYEELKNGGSVRITKEIKSEGWGYRQFSMEDLDGNEIMWFRFLSEEEEKEVEMREKKKEEEGKPEE